MKCQVYIYMCIYVYVCVCVYIYIYIYIMLKKKIRDEVVNLMNIILWKPTESNFWFCYYGALGSCIRDYLK